MPKKKTKQRLACPTCKKKMPSSRSLAAHMSWHTRKDRLDKLTVYHSQYAKPQASFSTSEKMEKPRTYRQPTDEITIVSTNGTRICISNRIQSWPLD